MHTHITPHQLASLDERDLQPGASYGAWFRAGDYHDTLIMPMNAPVLPSPTNASDLVPTVPTVLNLRFQPGEIPGWAVLHCHLLAVRFCSRRRFLLPALLFNS